MCSRSGLLLLVTWMLIDGPLQDLIESLNALLEKHAYAHSQETFLRISKVFLSIYCIPDSILYFLLQ